MNNEKKNGREMNEFEFDNRIRDILEQGSERLPKATERIHQNIEEHLKRRQQRKVFFNVSLVSAACIVIAIGLIILLNKDEQTAPLIVAKNGEGSKMVLNKELVEEEQTSLLVEEKLKDTILIHKNRRVIPRKTLKKSQTIESSIPVEVVSQHNKSIEDIQKEVVIDIAPKQIQVSEEKEFPIEVYLSISAKEEAKPKISINKPMENIHRSELKVSRKESKIRINDIDESTGKMLKKKSSWIRINDRENTQIDDKIESPTKELRLFKL